MHYIVGLGNPGEKYEKTRHNVGFLVLDFVLAELGLSNADYNMNYDGKIASGEIANKKVVFLYPETFMNNSGVAVGKLVSPAEIGSLIVIYDDVDLPLGKAKVSVGRGDGGHNGIKSIITNLGDKDFVRVRIGVSPVNAQTGVTVRPQGEVLANFVLKDFSKRELEELTAIKSKVLQLLEIIVKEGVEKAMTVGNGG